VDGSRVLDTLVNNLDGMAYRCRHDADWTMLFVSQGCLDLTGYAPEDLIENACISWEEITLPEDRGPVREKIAAALAARRRFTIQYRIVTADGKPKWVMERGIGVTDEDGEPVIEGFIEDISARHKTQEALENAELRFRHIFEHASEGIFQTTRDGHYLAANPALARLYGYETAEELIADLSDIEHRLYVDAQRRSEFARLMEMKGEVADAAHVLLAGLRPAIPPLLRCIGHPPPVAGHACVVSRKPKHHLAHPDWAGGAFCAAK
jgi:PAS domain S-box-containing protein